MDLASFNIMITVWKQQIDNTPLVLNTHKQFDFSLTIATFGYWFPQLACTHRRQSWRIDHLLNDLHKCLSKIDAGVSLISSSPNVPFADNDELFLERDA